MTTTTASSTGITPQPDAERRRRLRRGVAAYSGSFFAVVIGLVAVARASGADINHLDEVSVTGQLALFGAAFVPTLAMLVAWAASGIGPSWGFRRTSLRVLAIAWLVPMLAAVLGYLPAWMSDVAGFDPNGMHDRYGGLPLPIAVAVGVLPGLVPWIALAIGEELGWSSWFVVRLAELRGRMFVAVSFGLLWGLGHVPMMLLIPGAVADGMPKIAAVALFLTQTVALGFPMVYLRLSSRSIWPVLIVHAWINASIYFVADLLTVDYASTDHYLGEGAVLTGLATALSVLVTAPLWRRAG